MFFPVITRMAEEEQAITPEASQRAPIKYPFIAFSTHKYTPLETSTLTKNAFYYSFAIGALTAATQNSLARDGRGAMAVFTKSGKLWGAITAVVTTYQFSYCSISNLREQNDSINDYLAGALAGAVLGSFTKSLGKSVGTGLGVGLLCGITHWAGNTIGDRENNAYKARGGLENQLLHKEYNEGEKQGLWEAVRRRPLSEAKERLGEVALKP